MARRLKSDLREVSGGFPFRKGTKCPLTPPVPPNEHCHEVQSVCIPSAEVEKVDAGRIGIVSNVESVT